MIPTRSLLLTRVLRSAWTAGLIALMIAAGLEWGVLH